MEKIKFSEIFGDLIKNNKIFLLKKCFFFIFDKTNKFLINNLIQPKPEIYFAGNFRTYLDFKKNFKDKKTFKINSHDFNNFVKKRDKSKNNNNNIIFIDQVVEGSFDSRMGYYNKSKITKENYWHDMNNLFNIIIKKYPKNKILIAAHHRRNKFDLPLKNKKFIFDKTYQLIKNAKLVICHNSTVIGLAVLFRKPILLVNMDLFKIHNYENIVAIRSYSKALGAKMINIDGNFSSKKKVNFNYLFKVNQKKYKSFENYYIGYPELRSYGLWNTILRHLDNY